MEKNNFLEVIVGGIFSLSSVFSAMGAAFLHMCMDVHRCVEARVDSRYLPQLLSTL